eukprot:168744_1
MERILSLKHNEWIIHGKVYNLESFVANHPGGSLILNVNRRRDCTELFESYHFISNKTDYIETKLQQHYVRDALKSQIESPFDWNSEEYVLMKKELRHKFMSFFDKNQITSKANNKYLLMLAVLFVAWIITFYFYFQGYYFTLFTLSLLCWIFASDMLHSGAHYAIFKAPFWNEFVAKLFGWFLCPFLIWYYQHNISHHSYTNIADKDVDLVWHEEDYSVQRNKKHDKSNPRYRRVFMFLVPYVSRSFFTSYGVASVPFREKKLFRMWAEKFMFDQNSHYMKWEILITWLQIVLLLVIMPIIPIYQFGVARGLLFLVIPISVHGVLFHIFSQISHINEDSFRNEELKKSKNFIVHQILSASDYSIRSEFMGSIALGLNNHVLHHIVPSVHPCHYPKLSSILQQFCRKHNIQQSIHAGLYSCFRHHFCYLLDINFN